MSERINESKVCKVCGISKTLDLFRNTKTGFRTDCRKCENQKRIERRNLKIKEDPVYRNKIREYDKKRKRLSRMSKKTNV
jgi:hypothetical protein